MPGLIRIRPAGLEDVDGLGRISAEREGDEIGKSEDPQRSASIYYDEAFITGYEKSGYYGNLAAKLFVPMR